MKMMLIAGLVITFPAILVLVLNVDRVVALSALASLAVNSIPFIVGGMLLRKGGGEDEAGH
jgi:uncharacterized membrane protein